MGAQPTKPSDVSDAAWERVQRQKLEAVNEQQVTIKEIKNQRHEALGRLQVDTLQYCSACHDVPWVMMLLPSNRQKCAEARAQMFNDVTTLVSAIADENIANDAISKISKI